MNTQPQQATYYQNFKDYCTKNNLTMDEDNLILWDKNVNKSKVTSSFGSTTQLQDIGLRYMCRLWIAHYSQITVIQANQGAATLSSVRKSSGGMKSIDIMSPVEKVTVKNKIERHLETTVKRAGVLGTDIQKLIDIVVKNAVDNGVDLQTIINYVMASYAAATAAQVAAAQQQTAGAQPAA
jgi:hypothetical protein